MRFEADDRVIIVLGGPPNELSAPTCCELRAERASEGSARSEANALSTDHLVANCQPTDIQHVSENSLNDCLDSAAHAISSQCPKWCLCHAS